MAHQAAVAGTFRTSAHAGEADGKADGETPETTRKTAEEPAGDGADGTAMRLIARRAALPGAHSKRLA